MAARVEPGARRPGETAAFDALAGKLHPVPAGASSARSNRRFHRRVLPRKADAAVAAFADARAIVLAALDDLGWTDVALADGAFYVCSRGIGRQLGPHPDSESWCEALLEQHSVALTPGLDFDQRDGGASVRVSLAAGPEAVAAALIRILQQQSLKT